MDKQENFGLNTSYVQVVDRYKETISDLSAIVKRLGQKNEELKEEIRQLHRRNPEELYTLFGKPIKYWEKLQAENEELKQALEEIREVAKVRFLETKNKDLFVIQDMINEFFEVQKGEEI